MEQGFIDILKQVAKEQGKETFLELKKCRATVSDYTKSDYRNERGMLLRAVEEGVSNALFSAEIADIDNCMKAQQHVLCEEQFMDNAIAWNIVFILAYVLRDITIKEIKTESKVVNNELDEAMRLYYEDQFKKAAPSLEKFAKQGHAGAQCGIAWCFYLGEGVPQDFAKCIEWLNKAAGQGYAEAQYLLGYCYSRGDLYGDGIDAAKAAEWFRKAADQGHAVAQHELAFLYKTGEGVQRDFAKAVELYQKSADQGYADAQVHLGVLYYEGIAVPKDVAKAVELFQKSAAQGNESAKKRLDKIKMAENI
jgi:TPR repeat protein